MVTIIIIILHHHVLCFLCSVCVRCSSKTARNSSEIVSTVNTAVNYAFDLLSETKLNIIAMKKSINIKYITIMYVILD